MKNLTKYITAALIAMFATIVLSTTLTYAATSVDVYCDGVDDQEKIFNVLADDTIINIYGDCAFTSYLTISGYNGLVLQGDGNTTFTKYAPFFPGIIAPRNNSSLTINDIIMIRDPATPDADGDGANEAIDVYSSNIYLNNVIMDGFSGGITFNGSGSVLTATGLVITNTRDMTVLGLQINLAISLDDGNNIINWISGRSDAETAIGMFALAADVPDIASRFSISNSVLSESDFEMTLEIFEGFGAFVTTAPINKLVNCGFPVGSEWDICPDTGGGEEPGGGNNENEIEAPGTGIGNGINTTIVIATGLLIIGCVTMVAKRARL